MPTNLFRRTKETALDLLRDVVSVYLTLLRILVPALIVVKVLEMLGGTEWLGRLLAPVMGWIGLPESAGLVWAATLMTNIYGGMIVFFEVAGDAPFTVAQITVLGTLMVVGHTLPVEGAVARQVAVPWWVTIALRVGGALLLGWILNTAYTAGGWLQAANEIAWHPEHRTPGLIAWVVRQLQTLGYIFVIILALMALLKLLRRLGIERVLHMLLFPLLRLMGIGRQAANTAIIGITLGLSFGAGLLIAEARSGRLTPRDAFLTLCFLGVCHGLIEDTLLVMLLGADLSGILWARLVFAFVVIALIARLPLPRRESLSCGEAGRG